MTSLKQIYDILIMVQIVVSLPVFMLLLFVYAPYGRFNRPGWGITINSRAAWFVMELPAVLTILSFFLVNLKAVSIVNIVFLIVWETHYIYRTFIYPVLLRGVKKDFPLLLVLFAMFFNLMNGSINGYYLTVLHPRYDLSWLASPLFIAGIFIFIFGFGITVSSDTIIRRIRKGTQGEKKYGVPQGGLFRYVASPHYFGEMVEWLGFAVMTWSLPGLAFFLFTAANLIPRAIANYRWYKQTFPDFPPKRKIVFPFIF